MGEAQRRAIRLRRKYGVTGVPTDHELDAILAGEGVTLLPGQPVAGRVKELYTCGHIALVRGLPHDERRWLICHALGHHLLHEGDHLSMSPADPVLTKQERAAEVFAGYLLFGEHPPMGWDDQGLAPFVLAEWADVPVPYARSWWRMVSG